MSPRPYRLGRRQGAIEKTRKRVLRAARDLLAVRGGAELGDGFAARNQGRGEVVRAVVKRLTARYGRPAPDERAQVEEMLYTLTSFETFDTLAGPKRGLEEVAPAILQLARAATGLSPQA